MKTKHLYIIFCFNMLCSVIIVNAANYQTIASGDWNDTAIWFGSVVPPNNVNGDNITIEAAHTVIMDSALTFNNNCVLNVYGNLTVNNDFTVNNNFDLNVTGTLIINGNFEANNNAIVSITSTGTTSISGNATFNNGADISLNGNLTVDGALAAVGNSEITGNGTLSAGSLSGFDVGAGITVILPIELLSFNCIYSNNQTLLEWTTASETNNDFFTIERSTDGINFIAVSNVNGAGNSNHIINYEYMDKEIATATIDKIVYYRLKQTDFDSKTSYSNTKAVHIKQQSIQAQLFPNPATPSALYLSINTIPESDLTLTLFDAAGRKINQMLINKDNISSTIDISPLIDNAKGYYFIQISSDNAPTSMKPLLVK